MAKYSLPDFIRTDPDQIMHSIAWYDNEQKAFKRHDKYN